MRRHQGLYLEKRGRLGPTGVGGWGGGSGQVPPPLLGWAVFGPETGGRRNKEAAGYYRTAAASRWAGDWLAAGTGRPEEDTEDRSFDRLVATATGLTALTLS